MKKIKINGELALLIALVFLAIGIVLIIKADFGMTVVQAPVFILSESLTFISMGTWNYIIQGSLFVIMLLIIKKFRISYLLSFVSGILYGFILDLFIYLLRNLNPNNILMAILFYIIGFICICIAVSLFFSCKAPLMPYDIFIREVAATKKIALPKFKWIFDISCLIIAISLSLLLNRNIIGIGIGTIIFTFTVSPVMSQFVKLYDKFIIFIPLVPYKP